MAAQAARQAVAASIHGEAEGSADRKHCRGGDSRMAAKKKAAKKKGTKKKAAKKKK